MCLYQKKGYSGLVFLEVVMLVQGLVGQGLALMERGLGRNGNKVIRGFDCGWSDQKNLVEENFD